MNSFEFERYEIRQSFWLFGTTIFIFEIFILILHISLLTLSSRFGFHDIIFLGLSVAIWEIIALHLFNTVVLFYKVLSWYSKYYTVGHHSIARAEGIISKKIESQDIRMITKTSITTGILGRIFDYGDLTIENSFTLYSFTMYGIPNPEKWEKTIQDFHQTSREKSPLNPEEFLQVKK